MTTDDRALARQSVMQHEGFSPRPQPDRVGQVIGYGWNFVTGPPLTKAQGQALLESQMDALEAALIAAWSPYLTCDGPRQRCLLEMAYQLGVGGLLTFVKMLHAIAVKPSGPNPEAAAEVLNSGLARQTPSRAQFYAELLKEA